MALIMRLVICSVLVAMDTVFGQFTSQNMESTPAPCVEHDLPVPADGDVSCLLAGTMLTCNLTCSPGYAFEGQDYGIGLDYSCFAGVWMPDRNTVPDCQRVCVEDLLPVPDRGARDCQPIVDNSTSCNVTCAMGYYFPGTDFDEDFLTFYCSGGIWTPFGAEDVECVRVDFCENTTCHNGATCQELRRDSRCLCRDGFAGSSCEIDIDECASRPCLNGATCRDEVAAFTCVCDRDWEGVLCDRERVRNPQVSSLSPGFGPQAGGTVITISGEDFIEPVQSVFLGSNDRYRCTVLYSTRTLIHAMTPPANDSDVDKPLPVLVVHAGTIRKGTIETFEYRGNPKIENIHPIETLQQGGTMVTVEGTSMNAVASPVIEVTVTYIRRVNVAKVPTYNETSQVFYGPCSIVDVREVQCITPELDIPDEFKNIDNSTTVLTTTPSPSSGGRRRQEDGSLNFRTENAELRFYLGFLFDGVDEFQNLSANAELSEFAQLIVYQAPTIANPDPNKVIEFRKGSPILVTGKDFTRGVLQSDYLINVGQGVCNIQDFTDDSIQCLPPQKRPKKRANSTSTNHQVIVNIGVNIQYRYSDIYYEPDTTTYIIAGTTSGAAVLIAVIVGLAVYFYRKRRLGKPTGPGQQHHIDPSDEFEFGPIIMDDVDDPSTTTTFLPLQPKAKPKPEMTRVNSPPIPEDTYMKTAPTSAEIAECDGLTTLSATGAQVSWSKSAGGGREDVSKDSTRKDTDGYPNEEDSAHFYVNSQELIDLRTPEEHPKKCVMVRPGENRWDGDRGRRGSAESWEGFLSVGGDGTQVKPGALRPNQGGDARQYVNIGGDHLQDISSGEPSRERSERAKKRSTMLPSGYGDEEQYANFGTSRTRPSAVTSRERSARAKQRETMHPRGELELYENTGAFPMDFSN